MSIPSSCSVCGNMSHKREDCHHAVKIAEIHKMARLADYYLELVCPNYEDKICVTWRHNSHNPKNFCSGEAFLQMCRDTIEYRNRKQ